MNSPYNVTGLNAYRSSAGKRFLPGYNTLLSSIFCLSSNGENTTSSLFNGRATRLGSPIIVEVNNLTLKNNEDDTIINRLKKENETLKERIEELEQIIMKNQKIVDSAKKYREEHTKLVESTKKLKAEYEKAIADINLQKKLYKIEMDNLLSTVKKNVETE